LNEILSSEDDILVRAYYDCLQGQYQTTTYKSITDFYQLRNKKMMQRLDCIIQKYPGKRIVVLTGADHRPFLVEHLHKSGIRTLVPLSRKSAVINPKTH
jgi:hypothetical protein